MKRLFSKLMLGALITSLASTSVQANPSFARAANIAGSTLLWGAASYLMSRYICSSYEQEAQRQISGLNMLSQSSSRDFDNVSRNPEDPVLGEDGTWDEVDIQGTIASLRLPNEATSRFTLVSKIESLRRRPTSEKRTDVIQTCNRYRDAIQATAQRNITLAKYGLPIFGALLGFVYNWLNK